jgi:hypothetical protein
VAKLNWGASFLALEFNPRDERNAMEVSPDTKNYLQAMKFRVMQELLAVDLADSSRDNILAIAGFKANIKLLDELLAFFTSNVVNDETQTID